MFKYLHNGFIPGIPARDLTDKEAEQFGKARLKKSGLYQEVRERKHKEIEIKEPEPEAQAEE